MTQSATNWDEAFRALGDPVRWTMLSHLRLGDEVDRISLLREMLLSETMMSYHAKVLASAKLITIEKRGRSLYYALRSDSFRALEVLLGDLGNR